MPKFRVKWIDRTEYEAEIEANSAEEALTIFREDGVDSCEATGFVEMEEGSEEIGVVHGE